MEVVLLEDGRAKRSAGFRVVGTTRIQEMGWESWVQIWKQEAIQQEKLSGGLPCKDVG
jgi:hypothetical protein